MNALAHPDIIEGFYAIALGTYRTNRRILECLGGSLDDLPDYWDLTGGYIDDLALIHQAREAAKQPNPFNGLPGM